jgi:phosphohistidine phosphatase
MKRLLVLRHAKSDWSRPGVADHDRPLSQRGRQAASAMGEAIAALGLMPDAVLSSSARRARETLALAAAGWPDGLASATTFDRGIYLKGPGAILAGLARTPPEASTLLVVGHNPDVQALVLTLASPTDSDPGALARVEEKFPTAALALLYLPVDSWAEVAASGGRLQRVLTPKDLAAGSLD